MSSEGRGMGRVEKLWNIAIMAFAVYLLAVQRWDQATAFAVTILMMNNINDRR